MKEVLNPNEWIVMSALWDKSPLTLSEAIAQIGDVGWGYKTYQSYMLLLEKKGFVGAEKRGRDKFYYPLMSREECVRQETKNIVGKMKSDTLTLLIASMIREGGLSTDEHRELTELMEDMLRREGK